MLWRETGNWKIPLIQISNRKNRTHCLLRILELQKGRMFLQEINWLSCLPWKKVQNQLSTNYFQECLLGPFLKYSMERLYHSQCFSLFMHYLVEPFGIPIVQQWTFTIIRLNLCNCSTRNALRTALQCFEMLWNVMEDGKWAFGRKLSFYGGNFIMVSNLINNLLGALEWWLCPSLRSLRSFAEYELQEKL